MKEGLNVTKSIAGDVSVPMATTRESADDIKGEPGGCRSVCGVVRVCHGRIILCFLSYLSRFVYGFCVIWNSSFSRVWL
jgi:hypothetical protein